MRNQILSDNMRRTRSSRRQPSWRKTYLNLIGEKAPLTKKKALPKAEEKLRNANLRLSGATKEGQRRLGYGRPTLFEVEHYNQQLVRVDGLEKLVNELRAKRFGKKRA